jgi:hypothetical protein
MIVFSCNKEKSLELGSGDLPAGSNQWQFTETIQFKGNMDTAYFQTIGSLQSLILQGVSTDSSQGVFFLQIIGAGASISATTYSNPSVLFEYSVGGTAFYSNDPNAIGQFSVTITKLDSTSVSGTFTGAVKDVLNNAKTITDGKFSAKLGGSSSTGGGNNSPTSCKVSNIAYYDPNSNAPLGSITSFFNASNQVTKVQVVDSTSGPNVLNEFNLAYTSSQVNVDSKQYFSVAPGGLINQFHGFLDPTDNTSPKVFFTYNYNSSGQMSQCKIYIDTLGGILALTETLNWTGGNMTTATLQPVGTTEKTVIDYDFDLGTPVSGSLCYFPNSELIVFQSAVNFGKNNANALTTTTRKDYDSTGSVMTTSISHFGSYALDAGSYVKNLTITGDPTVYNSDVKYALTWKCF